MKLFFIAAFLVVGFSLGVSYAQSGPPQVPPQLTEKDIEGQMQAVGCNAERQAAAQTIIQLRQQITDLQKKAADPPKSGATKH